MAGLARGAEGGGVWGKEAQDTHFARRNAGRRGAALLSLEAGALREASLALGPVARALAQHDKEALARVAAEVEALRTALRRLCAASQTRGRRTRERLAP